MAKRTKKTEAKAEPENKSQSGREATQWKPGQSGNPGGRPAVIREIRDLARENTLKAFNTLLNACEAEDAPWAARVAAAAHILDRGYGKPTQHVSQTVRHIKQMTDDELLSYLSGVESADSGEGIAAPESDQGLPN
jgi:hypothetical protein